MAGLPCLNGAGQSPPAWRIGRVVVGVIVTIELAPVGIVSSWSPTVGSDTWLVLPSVNRMWKLFWQLIFLPAKDGIGSAAEPGSGFTSAGTPELSPFSNRPPMRSIASIVGVWNPPTPIGMEMPNSALYQAVRWAGVQSSTLTKMTVVPPPP